MTASFPLDTDKLLQVLNYVNLGVYITDLDRRILLWNRKAEEITGYKSSEVVGKCCRDNILQHVNKDGLQLCYTDYCPLSRAIKLGKENRVPAIIYAKKSSGSRVALTVSVAPLWDDSGKVIGAIETFRDETEALHDLEFASRIQKHLMPGALPTAEKIAFEVLYYPRDMIGGDFYDIRPIGEGRYGILVADVMGHGVSSALYTMLIKNLEDNLLAAFQGAGAFLTALNRELARVFLEGAYATALYAAVDSASGGFSYSVAGHPPPLHFHAGSKEVTELESHGFPLGVDSDSQYAESSGELAPGDLLLFYTDGITEVANAKGEMVRTAGLMRLLAEEIPQKNRQLLRRIYQRVFDSSDEVALTDDVLLLSVSRKS